MQAENSQITWTATEVGFSFLDLGRPIGAAEYAAEDAYIVIHAFTGAMLRCRTLAEARQWLTLVEDAIRVPRYSH